MISFENNQPLVSICIPVYNAERTVADTVQSVLNQKYRNLEIIIVDNASTDDTLEILQRFNDKRITIHENNENIGAERNWNRCIELANGEYIAIFHADDSYMPDIVQKQVETFQNNPSVGAVFTMANFINESGEVFKELELPQELKGREMFYFDLIFILLLSGIEVNLICPSAMVRKHLYKELAPFNVKMFGTSADLDMWFRIMERQPIAILDEKLMNYRVSKIQGTYSYNYLRTEIADYFKVMDHFLSIKASEIDIPVIALENYEEKRSSDIARCAMNFVIKGEPEEAKKLLRSSVVLRAAFRSIRRLKFRNYLPVGLVILFLIYIGLGRYLGRSVSWLLYRK